jgi:hypothetical protein
MFAASNTYDNNYIFMNPDGFKNATGSYCGCAGRRPQTFGRPRCFLVVDEEIFEEPRRERFVVAAVVHSFVHLFVRSFAWLCGLVRCHSPFVVRCCIFIFPLCSLFFLYSLTPCALLPVSIDDILNYDASKITSSIRSDVLQLLKAKASSFDQASITRVSVAAAPLAAWYVRQKKLATRPPWPFWLRLHCLVGSAMHIICFHRMVIFTAPNAHICSRGFLSTNQG